eukprot:SAG31_NODE_81_length_27131_cov_4.775283_20_plen_55_part_01
MVAKSCSSSQDFTHSARVGGDGEKQVRGNATHCGLCSVDNRVSSNLNQLFYPGGR